MPPIEIVSFPFKYQLHVHVFLSSHFYATLSASFLALIIRGFDFVFEYRSEFYHRGAQKAERKREEILFILARYSSSHGNQQSYACALLRTIYTCTWLINADVLQVLNLPVV